MWPNMSQVEKSNTFFLGLMIPGNFPDYSNDRILRGISPFQIWQGFWVSAKFFGGGGRPLRKKRQACEV